MDGQNVRPSESPAKELATQYGVDEKTIRRDGKFADDAEALVLLREVTTNPHGGDRKSENVIKCDNVTLDTDRGNSKAYSLDRLKRDRPDLFEKVVNNELSANKAMAETGQMKNSLHFADFSLILPLYSSLLASKLS